MIVLTNKNKNEFFFLFNVTFFVFVIQFQFIVLRSPGSKEYKEQRLLCYHFSVLEKNIRLLCYYNLTFLRGYLSERRWFKSELWILNFVWKLYSITVHKCPISIYLFSGGVFQLFRIFPAFFLCFPWIYNERICLLFAIC